ncbi:glycosyltransferase family protein [Acidiluteibacter ferrifornacis]|uniref:Glycosyltransferase RgtA/B/C/D-like domain-containing protein n=1 Tax=Acidiluteibacter ferrifornacis TaxID=2692424 RepID=A0A6N9NIH6_9FLAO|nr:hypothetical protein [Acidiluteibacter ferrifornacis]NBG65639.1 hypothetical protein [Acidiluteibacter ferrifornacis]
MNQGTFSLSFFYSNHNRGPTFDVKNEDYPLSTFLRNVYFHDKYTMEKLRAYFLDSKNTNTIAITVLFIGALIFYWPTSTLFPVHVHAWTQSDRLAIALCFLQNGFDFFHPCNFNLITRHGITAVDFPINEYIIACISYIFKWDIVTVFRTYMLLWGLIGLFFVYRFFGLLTRDKLKGLAMMLFTYFAPFYAYYLNGFLPSIPSFSLLFIGLYYILSQWHQPSTTKYLKGIIFLTLAALIRLPFVIPLFALLCLLVALIIKKREHIKQLYFPILGLVIVALYWLYNQNLSETYGSIFLDKFLSIDSMDYLSTTLGKIRLRWGGEYFSPYHYLLIAGSIWILIWKTVNPFHPTAIQRNILYFNSFYLLGCLLFFKLMGQQFVDHDYYFIDTFFPVILLFFGLGISFIAIKKDYQNVAMALFVIFTINMGYNTKVKLNERYRTQNKDRAKIAYRAFKDARLLMDELEISNDKTVLAIDAVTTNTPFILMNRSGVAVLSTDSVSIKEGLEYGLDYVTMIDTFLFSDVYMNYPSIIKKLDLVGQTSRIRFYQPTKDPKSIQFFQHLYHFSELNFNGSFDSIPNGYSNLSPTLSQEMELNSSIEYGLTYSQIIKSEGPLPIDVVVDADIWMPDTNSTATLVVSYGSELYEPFYIQNEIDTTGVWEHIQFRTQLPLNHPEEELKVYFWNADRTYMKYDNFKLLIAK